ncbi:hypothetical protein DFJ74DRAFT_763739 [Hyaloraphidium curvatum]|nr:hypothetical protein DFJ74DRAFT_763739 [Hyaloraphidium curvatum]
MARPKPIERRPEKAWKPPAAGLPGASTSENRVEKKGVKAKPKTAKKAARVAAAASSAAGAPPSAGPPPPSAPSAGPAAPDPADARSKLTLFVRNLPDGCTSADLEASFGEIGPIRSAFVVGGKDIGFVRFAIHEDAARAVEDLHNKNFRAAAGAERKIKVEFAKPKSLRKEGVEDEAGGGRAKKEKFEVNHSLLPAGPEKKALRAAKRAERAAALSKRTVPIAALLFSNLPPGLDHKRLYKKIRKTIPENYQHFLHPRILVMGYGGDPTRARAEVPDHVHRFVTKKKKDKGKRVGEKRLSDHLVERLNKHKIDDVRISVALESRREVPHPPKGRPADWSLPTGASASQGDIRVAVDGVEVTRPRLIVRNLHFSAGEKHLIKFFTLPPRPSGPTSPAVAPVSVSVSKTHEGKPAGFGFVEYATMADAVRGMDLNGGEMLGRRVAVDWSLPRERWEEVRAKEGEGEGGEESGDDGEDGSREGSSSGSGSGSDSSSDSDDGIKVTVDGMDAGSDGDGSDASGDEDAEISEGEDGSSSLGSEEDSDGETKKGDTDDGTTLFVRNLDFETTEEELKEKFAQFGRVRYVRLVLDKATGKPRGTAFVRFVDPSSSAACLARYAACEPPARAAPAAKGKDKEPARSILVPEPALSTPFHLRGRFLHVLPAVSREDSAALGSRTRKELRARDKRNAYLLREGLVLPGTPAAEGLSSAELGKRQASYDERRRQLEANPNLFVSKTRLSVRNLWAGVGEKELKALARGAVRAFDAEVRSGAREPLDEDAGEQAGGRVKQAKLLVEEDRIDLATGKPRSKGIGFVEFEAHADALRCLRWLNNNPDCYRELLQRGPEGEIAASAGKKKKKEGGEEGKAIPEARKRPIVEFAIENRLIVRKREAKIAKAKSGGAAGPAGDGDKGAAGKGGRPDASPGKRKREGAEDAPSAGKGKKQRHERWNQSSKKRKLEDGSPGKADGGAGAEKPAKVGKPGKKAKAGPAAKAGADGSKAMAKAAKPASKPATQPPAKAKVPHKAKKQEGAAAPAKKARREDREEARFDSMVDSYRRNLFG